MAARDAVTRMAQHRAAMTLALAEHLPLADARDRLARQRWAEADARLRRSRCGTEAAPPADEARDLPEQWWQRQ